MTVFKLNRSFVTILLTALLSYSLLVPFGSIHAADTKLQPDQILKKNKITISRPKDGQIFAVSDDNKAAITLVILTTKSDFLYLQLNRFNENNETEGQQSLWRIPTDNRKFIKENGLFKWTQQIQRRVGKYQLSASTSQPANGMLDESEKEVAINFEVVNPIAVHTDNPLLIGNQLKFISPTDGGSYNQAISFIVSTTNKEDLYFELIQRDDAGNPTGVGVPFWDKIDKDELQQFGTSYRWYGSKELPSASYSLAVLSGPLPLDLNKKVRVYFNVLNTPRINIQSAHKVIPPRLLLTLGKSGLGTTITLKFEHDARLTDFNYQFKKWDTKRKRWKRTTTPKQIRTNTSGEKKRVVTTARFRIQIPGKYSWTVSGRGIVSPPPQEFKIGSVFITQNTQEEKKEPIICFLNATTTEPKPTLDKPFDLIVNLRNTGNAKNDSSHKVQLKIVCKPLDGGKCKKLVSSKTVLPIGPRDNKEITIKRALKVTKGGRYKVTLTLLQPKATSKTKCSKKSDCFTFSIKKIAKKPGRKSTKPPGAARPGSSGSSFGGGTGSGRSSSRPTTDTRDRPQIR